MLIWLRILNPLLSPTFESFKMILKY